MQIGIVIEDGEKASGIKLSQKLNLEIIESINEAINRGFNIVLIVDKKGIGIKEFGPDNPIYVEFASSKASYRRKMPGKELIARAIGINKLKNPYVIDATAGLGRDSFVLASLGCKIHMLERSIIIATLLENGLERAITNPEITHIVDNMSLEHCDAITWLENTKELPDVIYLDPMFPLKTKTALVKKEMRLFKRLLGNDLDANKLLGIALEKAKYRVVAKRPRIAPIIAGKDPSHQILGSSSRFDVYVTKF